MISILDQPVGKLKQFKGGVTWNDEVYGTKLSEQPELEVAGKGEQWQVKR